MQIVIDIPDEMYDWLDTGFPDEEDAEKLWNLVKNGTPLKGHGNLIDENELIDEIVCEKIDGRYCDVIYAHSIYDAATIIEADKEESDKENDNNDT